MTDERDPKVSHRYRELGDEEPPRELDQAILAAAHRAPDRPHAPLVAPAGRHRWYFAFGAAAILVLAVAITVQLDQGQLDPEAVAPASAPPERKETFSDGKREALSAAPQPQEEARAKVQKPPVQPKPPSSPARDAAPLQEKPQAAEAARADRLEARQQQAPAVETQNASAAPPATPSTPQADSRDQTSGAATGLFSRRAEVSKNREAPPAAAPSPEATTRSQANVQEGRVVASVAPLTPERLLERIAELRKEGRHDDADKALAEFRQRYPEYRISEELLKKVERPK